MPDFFHEKNSRSRYQLKPKSPYIWAFMEIIPSTAPFVLTSDTIFFNYLLIIDSYSKTTKLYGMEKIFILEVMDNLDMFQSRFGKIDKFGWWDLEIISSDAGTKFA